MSGGRVAGTGIERVSRSVAFTFDGEPHVGQEGESLAAALCAAGRLTLGTGPAGTPRGLFCGMGICQECIVTVDGKSGQRACMTTLAIGMQVELQGYRVAVNSASPPMSEPGPAPLLHQPEVLVIGGGPAGLSAARGAMLCGSNVTLIDERPSLGGQYFKQLARTHRFVDSSEADAQFRQGRALIEEVEKLGVEVWSGASVWGAFPPGELAVSGADKTQHLFRPRRLIIATGAYERGVPVPGWTLPGFMATGAVQTLLRAYRVTPGRRVLIAGNGPLNLQLAVEFLGAGIKPVAVVEAAPRPGFGRLPALAHACANSPGLIRNGLAYLARLLAAGVPVIYERAVVAAEGDERVERAVTARIDAVGRPMPGTERDFVVDIVCAGYGLMPSTDISLALGCAHQFDQSRGCLLAESDEHGQTTMEGIFVVGDCAGLGGAQVALEQGFIAGTAAARTLGRSVSEAVETELRLRRRRLARHRAFQSSLRAIFDAPLLTYQLASPQTVVCRCEGVHLETITAALAAGGCSLSAVKKRTRAGMGRCQGRYCSPVIASFLPAPGEMRIPGAFLAPRPPIKPVPIAEIAETFDP